MKGFPIEIPQLSTRQKNNLYCFIFGHKWGKKEFISNRMVSPVLTLEFPFYCKVCKLCKKVKVL